MYKKSAKGWLKHWDFMLLDMICLQVAFVAAYMIRHGANNPYSIPVYQNEAIALVLIQLVVSFLGENFKSVLRRGYYNEFVATVKQAFLVTLMSTFYLFMIQSGNVYSRLTLLMTGSFYCVISYVIRLLWKKHLLTSKKVLNSKRSIVILTNLAKAEETIKNISDRNCINWNVRGLVIMDRDMTGETVADISVVANKENVAEYVCREWVDEVLVNLPYAEVPEDVLAELYNMGVTVHQSFYNMNMVEGRMQYVERIGQYTVLTTSVKMVTNTQLFYKRMLDIIGGIVGCLLTIIMYIFLAPIIFIKSPGPIIFTQTRVGRNGKKFKMYKFRSMYMDAEERKKELLEANRVKGGMMFKMKDDPRIIKGIGHFIRKYSIDEFPQFFNVLKGDMSLVGTRPPTVDEWEKYALHHRTRLAIKPGITGMWQVSGRSDITDFEEVVKLDVQYISKWNIGLDLKILLKTVGVVIGNNGAM